MRQIYDWKDIKKGDMVLLKHDSRVEWYLQVIERIPNKGVRIIGYPTHFSNITGQEMTFNETYCSETTFYKVYKLNKNEIRKFKQDFKEEIIRTIISEL
jgi:D-mannonate dehydratase